MGLLESLSRLFGFSRPEPQTAGAMPATAGADRPSRGDDGRVAAIREPASGSGRFDDLDADVIELESADASEESEAKPMVVPKNRAQLISELQKNYTEVLGLVRKVDGHLDEQQRRADRMLSIAQDSAEKLEHLPELAAQTGRVADAIAQLVELTRSGQGDAKSTSERLTKTAIQQLETMQQQTSTLHQVQSAIHRSGEAERELAESVGQFRESLGGVSASTSRLGEAITAMRETDAEREAELARLVKSGQRSMFLLVGCVAVIGTVAIGTLIAVVTGAI